MLGIGQGEGRIDFTETFLAPLNKTRVCHLEEGTKWQNQTRKLERP